MTRVGDHATSWLDPAVLALAAMALALVPLLVLAQGYVPPDDALRHAAKVVAGRPWSEILVLDGRAGLDLHAGWHALLGAVHAATGLQQHGLVAVAVVLGALVVLLPPLLCVRRPESWLLALLPAALATPWPARVLLGRPFLLSVALVLLIAFTWRRLGAARRPWPLLGLLAVGTALCVQAHTVLSLLPLPVLCTLLARRWRVAGRLLAALAVGVLLGALASGAPLAFLRQTVWVTQASVDLDLPADELVFEFRPASGDATFLLFVAGLLLATRPRAGGQAGEAAARGGRRAGGWRAALRDPAAVLAGVGWLLGLRVMRFWLDWGLPALLAVLARRLDAAARAAGMGVAPDAGPRAAQRAGGRRLALAVASALALVAVFAGDIDQRWTQHVPRDYLDARRPAVAAWLPGAGGIVYSASMALFYETFFALPHAPWRYVLGFEPANMPPADLAVYREARLCRLVDAAFLPWAQRLRDEDRLCLVRPGPLPPANLGLLWRRVAGHTWIGCRPAAALRPLRALLAWCPPPPPALAPATLPAVAALAGIGLAEKCN